MKTVNNRYLDINLRMPRSLSNFEDDIRKRIQQKISRGRVEVFIGYQNKGQDQVNVTLNEGVQKHTILRFWPWLTGFNWIPPDLAVLSGIEDIFVVTKPEEDEDLLKQLMFDALDDALELVADMREKEGRFIAEDLEARSHVIQRIVDAVEQRSPAVIEEYRQKLRQRMEDLLNNTELDENRFQMEVAYYAERSNITEEIVRLKSHLIQLRQTLKSGGCIGRKLDFIIQEMNREINTIDPRQMILLLSTTG